MLKKKIKAASHRGLVSYSGLSTVDCELVFNN